MSQSPTIMPTEEPIAVSVPKYRRIADAIHRRIQSGELPAEASLPSQRELMEEHGVALITVRQAVAHLKERGLVEARPGSGVYVCPGGSAEYPISSGHRPVGFGIVRYGAWINYDALESRIAAASELMGEHQFDARLRGFNPDQIDAVCHWADQLQGVILWGKVSPQLVRAVRERGKPVVVCGEMIDGPCPADASQISVDVAGMASMALGYLHALGHRRIAFVNTQHHADHPGYGDHVLQALEHEADAFSPRPALLHWSVDPEDDGAALLDHFGAADVAPTALFVLGETPACRAMEALLTEGWSIPERLSVMATSNLKPTERPLPRLSAVHVPGERIFRESVEMLAGAIDHGHVGRRVLPPRMHFGQTCAAPPTGPTGSEH